MTPNPPSPRANPTAASAPSVLMVGAGAVGQVFGRHLQLGGAKLGFFVRPSRKEWASGAHELWQVKGARRREPHTLRAAAVFCEAGQVNPADWDQLWLAVPSPAVRDPALEPLLRAFAGRPVVTTTPGWGDQEHLAAHCGRQELAQVMTGFLAWFGPLAGDRGEVNTAHPEALRYWFPPLAPSLISGPAQVVTPALHALKRGGLPIRRTANARLVAGFASAAMMPTLAALESQGWSASNVRAAGRFSAAAEAGREAVAAVAASERCRPPLWRPALRGASLSLMLRLAPLVAPIPIDAFLALHFTKVGDQTREMLDTYAALAAASGLPHAALDSCRNWICR